MPSGKVWQLAVKESFATKTFSPPVEVRVFVE